MIFCFITAARSLSVAFTASRSSSFSSSIGLIIFDNVITNLGGGYNSSTGIFACPSDGAYVFTWTHMTQNGNHCYVYLNINGTIQDQLQAFAHLGGFKHTAYSQPTMTGTFQLSKGDNVSVHTTSCSYYYGSPYNAFSGWKLWCNEVTFVYDMILWIEWLFENYI